MKPLALLILNLATLPAAAATLEVTTVEDSGPGSLREALESAVDGDEITFSGVTEVAVSSGDLEITADVHILGGGVTLQGDGSTGLLTVDADASVIIEDLTLAGGFRSGTGRGAGIYNDGEVTLVRSVIRDCRAFNAAAFDNHGTMSLVDSAVIDNSTTGNSGAGGVNYGSLSIVGSVFANNAATGSDRVGGGLAQISVSFIGGEEQPAVLAISHSSFVGNSATGYGGGLFISGGSVSLRNVLIADNEAPSGADIWGEVSSAGFNLIGDTGGATVEEQIGDRFDTTSGATGLDDSGSFPFVAIERSSAAYEAGDCTAADGSTVETDVLGTARPQGFACDIGAYELVVDELEVDSDSDAEACEHGGVRTDIGYDIDGDGALSEAEIHTSSDQCFDELTETIEVAPGEDCPAGGERTDTGVDSNLDGVLDEDEIDTTRFDCDEPAVDTDSDDGIVEDEQEASGCSSLAAAPVGLGLLLALPLMLLRRRS